MLLDVVGYGISKKNWASFMLPFDDFGWRAIFDHVCRTRFAFTRETHRTLR